MTRYCLSIYYTEKSSSPYRTKLTSGGLSSHSCYLSALFGGSGIRPRSASCALPTAHYSSIPPKWRVAKCLFDFVLDEVGRLLKEKQKILRRQELKKAFPHLVVEKVEMVIMPIFTFELLDSPQPLRQGIRGVCYIPLSKK